MELIAKADVVLALGTRLNPFSTLPGYGIDYWPKDAEGHPGRHQPRPHRPDQEGHRRHRGRRQGKVARAIWRSCPMTPATPAARTPQALIHRQTKSRLGAGTVLAGSRGRRSRHHLERANRARDKPIWMSRAHGLAGHPVRAAEGGDHLVRHRQQLRHRQRLPDLRAGPQIPRTRPVRSPAATASRRSSAPRSASPMCRWSALPATAPSGSP
jgi:hypothetical protein